MQIKQLMLLNELRAEMAAHSDQEHTDQLNVPTKFLLTDIFNANVCLRDQTSFVLLALFPHLMDCKKEVLRKDVAMCVRAAATGGPFGV